MFNSITTTGNLAADPELRFLPTGMAVCNFSIYNTYKYGKGKEDTTIFKVCFFAKQAELANEFLGKGDMVIVSGRMRLVKFIGREGTEVTYAEIIGSDFRTLTPKASQSRFEDEYQEEGSLVGAVADVDDLPF